MVRSERDPNGNWIFYRNGTVVVTRRGVVTTPGGAAQVQTAFGRGGHIPGRRIAMMRRLTGNPNLRVGDPEPPIRLTTYVDQNRGTGFDSFRIWP